MAQQQQMQQPNQPQGKGRKGRPWVRWLILVVTFPLIAVGIIIWIISSKGPWLTILPIIIFTVLTVVIGLFQWLFPVTSGTPERYTTTPTPLGPQVAPVTPATPVIPQIVVHMPSVTQPLPSLSLLPDRVPYRGIIGFPPPTDSRTIQQRAKIVKEVYEKLIQPDITSIVLTGIGGVGKSTLAALIHRYAEEQRHLGNGPFTAAALWLGIKIGR